MDLRICIYAKYILKKFDRVNENLTYYRRTENNISSNKRSEQNYYANCVKKNIIPELKV